MFHVRVFFGGIDRAKARWSVFNLPGQLCPSGIKKSRTNAQKLFGRIDYTINHLFGHTGKFIILYYRRRLKLMVSLFRDRFKLILRSEN